METEERKIQTIGFVGIESCELICYIGRILYTLGKRVLLADCSELGALMDCVPEPHYPLQPDFTTERAILEYRGLSFLNYGEFNSYVINSLIKDLREKADYDYLLIDFGFKVSHEAIRKCDRLIMCSDQKRYNIRRLAQIEDYNPEMKVILLIRDYISGSLSEKRILQELRLETEDCELYRLPYNEGDLANRLTQRYPAQGPFRSCSEGYKQVLIKLTHSLTLTTDKKTVTIACRKAAVCKEEQQRRKAC